MEQKLMDIIKECESDVEKLIVDFLNEKNINRYILYCTKHNDDSISYRYSCSCLPPKNAEHIKFNIIIKDIWHFIDVIILREIY